jgi:putative CocE/NonD family hydrolase
MRDGVTLDTCVWLPAADTPAPAIFLRTPYARSVTAVNEPPLLRYLQAGYAVVMQQIRGVGRSGGRFAFNAPHDRTDGYDSVEWIAAQPWCTGAVGMDGHSYAGMTQLTAAAARPPSLRCIVPAVPSTDFFLEPPYIGGVFSRMHTLVWGEALQFADMLDAEGGQFRLHGFLTDPALLQSWLSRPVRSAAEGVLQGDLLLHYRDVLDHPVLDDWWQARTLGPADFATMDLPVLLVSGNFDPSVGALTLWRGLEAHAANAGNRHLLIGPWDHNGAYNGGAPGHGPYRLGEASDLDLVAHRIRFFDRHLKAEGDGLEGSPRVSLFLTGANRWHHADSYPPRDVARRTLFLASGGHANSARGDGRLVDAPLDAATDRFVDDPDLPLVGPLTMLKGPEHMLDLAELARMHDVLVYATDPLSAPLTLLGEAEAELVTSADAPDADLCLTLAEQRADGRIIQLAFGQLRLRYHQGFDREVPLMPGEPVRVRIPLTHVGHRLPAGHRLVLLVAGGNFPLLDPNPHGAGPIADQPANHSAVQAIHHGGAHASRLHLPVCEDPHG